MREPTSWDGGEHQKLDGKFGQPREGAVGADQLRKARLQWHEAPPMTERVLRQWWGNVRMRWNCHSTAIEGSRLSYRDTLDILVRDRTPNGGHKNLLDVDQIRGHNESARMLVAMYNRRHRVDIPDLHAVHKGAYIDKLTTPTTDLVRGSQGSPTGSPLAAQQPLARGPLADTCGSPARVRMLIAAL